MGARIKRLREAAGLSQAKLAERAGVSLRAVQNWEYGTRSFDFYKGIKLAEILGCSLNDLAGLGQSEADAASEPAKKTRKRKEKE